MGHKKEALDGVCVRSRTRWRARTLLRMSRRGEGQMPPLEGGARQIDLAGVTLLEEWIRGLPGCAVEGDE